MEKQMPFNSWLACGLTSPPRDWHFLWWSPPHPPPRLQKHHWRHFVLWVLYLEKSDSSMFHGQYFTSMFRPDVLASITRYAWADYKAKERAACNTMHLHTQGKELFCYSWEKLFSFWTYPTFSGFILLQRFFFLYTILRDSGFKLQCGF